MFCCDGLKNLVGNAGQREISALVYESPGGFRFGLQFRAVSRRDELLISKKQTPIEIEGNITLSAVIGLRHCPFCGTNLLTLVTPATRGRFEALAEEHREFDERPY